MYNTFFFCFIHDTSGRICVFIQRGDRYKNAHLRRPRFWETRPRQPRDRYGGWICDAAGQAIWLMLLVGNQFERSPTLGPLQKRPPFVILMMMLASICLIFWTTLQKTNKKKHGASIDRFYEFVNKVPFLIHFTINQIYKLSFLNKNPYSKKNVLAFHNTKNRGFV